MILEGVTINGANPCFSSLSPCGSLSLVALSPLRESPRGGEQAGARPIHTPEAPRMQSGTRNPGYGLTEIAVGGLPLDRPSSEGTSVWMHIGKLFELS